MTSASHLPPVPPEEGMFETAYGITLEGILHRPRPQAAGEQPQGSAGAGGEPAGDDGAAGEPAGGVVLCHPHPGLGGTMRTPLVVRLALGIAASGRAVLR